MRRKLTIQNVAILGVMEIYAFLERRKYDGGTAVGWIRSTVGDPHFLMFFVVPVVLYKSIRRAGERGDLFIQMRFGSHQRILRSVVLDSVSLVIEIESALVAIVVSLSTGTRWSGGLHDLWQVAQLLLVMLVSLTTLAMSFQWITVSSSVQTGIAICFALWILLVLDMKQMTTHLPFHLARNLSYASSPGPCGRLGTALLDFVLWLALCGAWAMVRDGKLRLSVASAKATGWLVGGTMFLSIPLSTLSGVGEFLSALWFGVGPGEPRIIAFMAVTLLTLGPVVVWAIGFSEHLTSLDWELVRCGSRKAWITRTWREGGLTVVRIYAVIVAMTTILAFEASSSWEGMDRWALSTYRLVIEGSLQVVLLMTMLMVVHVVWAHDAALIAAIAVVVTGGFLWARHGFPMAQNSLGLAAVGWRAAVESSAILVLCTVVLLALSRHMVDHAAPRP